MRSTDTCSGLQFLGMKSRRLLAVSAMVLATALGLVSQTVPPTGLPTTQRANRITQELGAGPNVAIAGTVHPLTRQAIDLGAVDSNLPMGSLTLNIGLSAAQQTELKALSEAQQDPKSPQYHQWLTQEQFGARFGLTDADLSKVTAWLTGQGFRVQRVSKSRNAIYFGGKAWQVESAFHTQLHQYKLDGETHFANATEIRVPAGIASVLLNVRGLHNFRLKPRVRKQIAPDYNINTSHFLSPGDWATIYDVTSIYNAGYTGTGAHVGVVGQTYAPQTDIDHFRNASGLPATKLTYVCIDATTKNCTALGATSTAGDLGEADLDIEWAGGIAKNATVDYVYAPYSDTLLPTNSPNALDVFSALQYAVQDYTVAGTVLPVISMSYGDCEQSFVGNASYLSLVTQLGQQANGQGQTIVVSSGDSGPAGCDPQGVSSNDPARLGISVGIPVDSPNYTGVGGTTLTESNSYAFWNGLVGLENSALGYIPESVWNATNNGLLASGGGESLYFTQPDWQNGLVSGTTGRLVPDVAFAADAGHDGYLICSSDYNSTQYGKMCANGFFSSGSGNNSVFYTAGGTSASTPSFAGMLTLLTQKLGSLGNVNPTLYKLAKNSTGVFHDVTVGENQVPCLLGTTGCASSGSMGFLATVGYDQATGLGSIDGGALLNAFATASSLGAATTTTVTASANSLTIGGTTTLSAAVSSTSVGAITGTVTFNAGKATLGTASVAGGMATLSNTAVSTANGFSVGNDSITASYGGDVNFAASSASTTLSVAWPYTLVANSTSVTGSSAVALTLTSSNYAGTVSFLTSVTTNGVPSNAISATATPVTLTSGGSGTSTLTITTGKSAGNHAPARPWKSGGAVVFCAVLLGAPFTIRRKRAVAVLLIAAVIALAGFLMACGGSAKAPRIYTVMVTPTGTGAVTNAATVNVVVTVP